MGRGLAPPFLFFLWYFVCFPLGYEAFHFGLENFFDEWIFCGVRLSLKLFKSLIDGVLYEFHA